MEIEFIATEPEKPKLTWEELKVGEWFIFNAPSLYEIYGLCINHYEPEYGALYRDQSGRSHNGNKDALITRVRIHKIVCEKVVEQ